MRCSDLQPRTRGRIQTWRTFLSSPCSLPSQSPLWFTSNSHPRPQHHNLISTSASSFTPSPQSSKSFPNRSTFEPKTSTGCCRVKVRRHLPGPCVRFRRWALVAFAATYGLSLLAAFLGIYKGDINYVPKRVRTRLHCKCVFPLYNISSPSILTSSQTRIQTVLSNIAS